MAFSEEGDAPPRDNQMLVERDGKYELVDAYDVQLATTAHQEAMGDADVGTDTSGASQLKDDQLTNQLTGKRESQEMVKKEDDLVSHEKLTDQDKVEDCDADTSGVVDVSITQIEPTVAKKDSVLSAVSTYALSREKEITSHISTSVRTKSAPGPRSRREEGDQQKRRNEAAFSAWLTSKNEELAKRRQMEKQECRMKEENLMHRQSLNEAAYKAWLERKTSELQLKRSASRPATSIPKVDEAAKQAAFEAWLESKREEHRKKVETEREKRSQEEEKAKNSDPTLVEQAYKKLVLYTII